MVTITRKIQILPQNKEIYYTLYQWNRIVRNAANLMSSHRFFLDNMKEMLYLDDKIKYKLENIAKPEKLDEEGNEVKHCLITGLQNSTYQVASKYFKGEINTDILTNLNQIVYKSYNKEKKEYFTGDRSLRNYKKNIPIPFSGKMMKDWIYVPEKKNYNFTLFKMYFQTFFGKDLSNNKAIVKKCLTGEYKICNSSIILEKELRKKDKSGKNNNNDKSEKKYKTKIFLLLTIQFEKNQNVLFEKNQLIAKLGIDIPVLANILKNGKSEKIIEIGNRDEYLYRRLRIQDKLSKLQADIKYTTNNAKGRHNKLKALERFKEIEKNYIKTKMHVYSRNIINIAIRYKCKSIILSNYTDVKEESHDDKFLIRNWNYYGLKELIKYKAESENINLIIE